MELKGFDISSWNHPNDESIDFAAAKSAGYGFVMIKCSQGLHYKNPYVAEDAHEAHHAGLLVGCYHYAEPGEGNAALQAKYAAAVVSSLPLSLGLALDLEETGTLQMHELGPWAEEFLKEVNAAGHGAPFYTNENYLTQLVGAPWGHKLWYASEHLPEFRQGLHIWMQQAVGSGTVAGVKGPVDLDVFYGVRGSNPPAGKAPVTAGAVEALHEAPTTAAAAASSPESLNALSEASGEPS